MADTRTTPPDNSQLTHAVADVLVGAKVTASSRLCVALSGGADSVVLLHLLARLRPRFGFSLQAFHVNHGLSPNADAWQSACATLCAALAVPFESCRVEVMREHPGGLEAAARSARHAALDRSDVDWVVLGHHRDDQAETLLFRLLRGTGVRGAGAMTVCEPGAPGRLRPLLEVGRSEIVSFARASDLTWVEDESNLDETFSRNRLRHAIFPALTRAFPAAVPMFARAAENFREASALLDALAQLDWDACGGGELRLSRLLRLDDRRVRNLVRWRIRILGAEMPTRARLVEAVRQMRAAGEHPLYLPLGPSACGVYRDRVWFERAPPVEPTVHAWRGEASVPWADGCVRFARARGVGVREAAIDAAHECILSPRWEGLRMSPGAGRPHRSFKKLCQEAGLPGWLRERVPVLRIDGAPAWIAHIGVAAAFACAPDEDGIVPHWEPLEPH